jgi:hypothetical protein
MSALTVFLGKLIGVYCLIVALTMIANRRTTVDAVNDPTALPANRSGNVQVTDELAIGR